MKTFKITRDITSDEQPWMPKGAVIKKDSVVYEYLGYTYGCITPGALAVTHRSDGLHPFFEVPHDAVEEIGCRLGEPDD